jgi:3-methyladenine DNA glycosylase/8-oxoguanine DNA glycosylase
MRLAEATKKKCILSKTQLHRLEPTEARESLLKLFGIGPYIAETLLRIYGIHNFYGLDSWNKKKISTTPKNKKFLDEKYSNFGDWRGLAFWLEATKNWYEDVRCWP